MFSIFGNQYEFYSNCEVFRRFLFSQAIFEYFFQIETLVMARFDLLVDENDLNCSSGLVRICFHFVKVFVTSMRRYDHLKSTFCSFFPQL